MKKTGERGFTLIEVLVALTVTAIIMTTVYGIFSGVSSAKQRLEQDGEAFHQARVLFDRLAREIRSAYFLSGAQNTLFRGGKDDDDRFYLEFTTTVVSPVLPQATGISRVRYEIREDAEASAADADDLEVLYRREESLLPGGAAGALDNRLAGGVSTFRLRFHDGNDWQEEWEAASQGLPQMVEIFLEFESDGVKIPFLTALEVPRIEAP